MAESDEGLGQDEAARLEAALERIAQATARRAPADAEAEAARAERMAAMAGRLDMLIAELREVLGPDDAAADAMEAGSVPDPAEPQHVVAHDPDTRSEPDLAEP